MRKILLLICIIFFHIGIVSAEEKLKIISRSEWWADESFRDQNSSHWQNIFVKRANSSAAWAKTWANLSQARKNELTEENRIKSAKFAKMNSYLTNNYYNDIKIVESYKYEWNTKLAWRVQKTNSVKNIVIHHTYSEYESSEAGIHNIYKYHALTRQWGDIGYHYVIDYEGKVYEGRAGWDYVVAAHDTWNNYSTVWIVVMGDYDNREMTPEQYNWLKKLVQHLTKKYWIDLNNKIPYHKECFWNSCANGLETTMYYPIVGHKDGKATSCPGHDIYENIIPQLLSELQEETLGYQTITMSQQKEAEAAYREKINTYAWEGLRTKFMTLPQVDQFKIRHKVKTYLEYENGWKNDILYQKLLDTIS